MTQKWQASKLPSNITHKLHIKVWKIWPSPKEALDCETNSPSLSHWKSTKQCRENTSWCWGVKLRVKSTLTGQYTCLNKLSGQTFLHVVDLEICEIHTTVHPYWQEIHFFFLCLIIYTENNYKQSCVAYIPRINISIWATSHLPLP